MHPRVGLPALLLVLGLGLACDAQPDAKTDAKADAPAPAKDAETAKVEPEPEPEPPPPFMAEPERLDPKGLTIADHERRSVDVGGLTRRGPEDAAVVVLECIDFADAYNKGGQKSMTEVHEALGERVAFYLRPYWNLLESQEQAVARGDKAAKARAAQTRRLAAALVAADRQGKLWPLHDQFVAADKDQLASEDLSALATAAGLDVEAFTAQLGDEQTLAAVEAHRAACQALGVDRATPAYFINGRMMTGARKADDMRYVVDVELHGGFEKLPPGPAEPAK